MANHLRDFLIKYFDIEWEFWYCKVTIVAKLIGSNFFLSEIAITLRAYKEISVTVSQKAKDRLIDLGYDPSMGARPLRRVIQDQIEDQVAEFYLDNPKIKDLFVDADEEGNLMVVSKVERTETTVSE